MVFDIVKICVLITAKNTPVDFILLVKLIKPSNTQTHQQKNTKSCVLTFGMTCHLQVPGEVFACDQFHWIKLIIIIKHFFSQLLIGVGTPRRSSRLRTIKIGLTIPNKVPSGYFTSN